MVKSILERERQPHLPARVAVGKGELEWNDVARRRQKACGQANLQSATWPARVSRLSYRPEGFGWSSFMPNVGTGRVAASPLSVTPGTGLAFGKNPAMASTPP